jgi:hypothetical protein
LWDATLVPSDGTGQVAQATNPLTVDSTVPNHVALVSAPTVITSPTDTHSVTIAYTAREKGDIILTLVDPANGFAWYGTQRQSVEPGQGNATFTVTVPFSGQSFPPNGTTYVWDAIIVKPGMDWHDPLPASNQADQLLTINAPADSVTIDAATGVLITPGTYAVTVKYFAREKRDIHLSVMDPNNAYYWYAGQTISVEPGEGSATAMVAMPAPTRTFPPDGMALLLDATIVPFGSQDTQHPLGHVTKPLTVDSAAQDAMSIVSAPTMLITEGTYSVTVQYTARTSGDIILSMMDTNDYAHKYVEKRLPVMPGQGSLTFTVPSSDFWRPFPPDGSHYVWDAILVPTGGDYTQTRAQDTISLTVDSTAVANVAFVSAPTAVTAEGTYQVTVAYTARADGDILLNLLEDPAGSNIWRGTRRQSVTAGQGTATFTVTVPSLEFPGVPPNGNNFVWEALLVPPGLNWDSQISKATASFAVGDTMTVTSAPATITTSPGTYQVTVAYTARENRDIRLNLLDRANGNAWYGTQVKSVLAGQGNTTFTVSVPGEGSQNFPPNGTGYVWEALLVPTGSDWTGKISENSKPVTVDAPPDTVTIASAPATLTTAGTYQVTVQYFARQNRDIVLSLLDPPNGNAWYGMQIKSVPTGQGNATFTVPVTGVNSDGLVVFNFPSNGTTYVWDAIIVPSGLDWHSKISGDTSPLTVTSTATAYDVWKAGVFTDSELNDPAFSGDLATPAHDGITNLMKYALGLDPMTSGASSLPTVSEQGGYLTLTYRKNMSATDVTYTVQATDSLADNSWVPATTVLSETDGGSFWLVTVRDNVTYAGTRRFMRLQVSK